ncbi:MAG: DUF167 domain-containing protein [Thermodesulfobacteriota bacterium]
MSHRPKKKTNSACFLQSLPVYIKPTTEGIVLNLWVQPGARKTEWSGLYGQQMKLMVQAPPVEGAANQSCIIFLARWFGIKKSDVVLLKGEKSRSKVFLLKGLTVGKGISLIPGQNQDLPS